MWAALFLSADTGQVSHPIHEAKSDICPAQGGTDVLKLLVG